jgi:hypothetical protein
MTLSYTLDDRYAAPGSITWADDFEHAVCKTESSVNLQESVDSVHLVHFRSPGTRS